MISKGYSYTAYSPVKTKMGKTMFKVKDYNKQFPTLKVYITVFCDNDVEIHDRQKVIFNEIKSISTSEYKGDLQISMSASVTIDTEIKEEFNSKGIDTVIDPDDLPF